ncbi:MAG TPA: glycogen/starch synthase [Acidobacteriota bacterium]|nr:glycogen/starch synthase [Acidobacteriota bacterium]
MAQRFRVAFVSAECVPFAKVGGLGDVVGALSRAVADLGCSVAVFLPRYESLSLPEDATLELVSRLEVPVAGELEPGLLYRLRSPSVPAHLHYFFVANERYFGRPGIYNDPATGEAYADDAERFIYFSRAALEGMRAVAFTPEVIHAHDQQTALVPVYLKTLYADDPFFQMTASLLSLHNLGYQGVHDPATMRIAGFPDDYFYPLSPFEYWGRMNFLKAGIHFADALTTVSERYAEEIQSGDEYGFGLQGTLNARREDLVGILNGIDQRVWNPRTDRHIAARYDSSNLEAKELCKAALLEEVDLPLAPAWPVVGIISRLADQKGFDLIEAAADRLFALPIRWTVLGSGATRYVEFFRERARRHPDRVAFRSGFDDPLAHRIEAGADFFLMPSRYEPCGLSQMMSMRYGTVPVARATGGLVDTIAPWRPGGPGGPGGAESEEATGILFEPYTPEALTDAVEAALLLYAAPGMLARIRRNGMARDFSWEGSARRYLQLYRQTNAVRRMGTGYHRWLESFEAGRSAEGPGGWTPPGPPLTGRKEGV